MRWLSGPVSVALSVVALGCAGTELTGPDRPAAAKLFGQSGQELTPNVAIPAARIIVAEIRFYRADGSVITGLEPNYSAIPRFDPALVASVGAIPGEKFKYELTGRSVGADGTMWIGFGAGSKTTDLMFGPFPVTVR